jgi:endonuclease YncB( thermonuclease family)/thiol-disulfide isomerase/thioredoxin
MIFIRTLIPLFVLCFAAPANALVLRGVVSEVPNGSSIVVISNGQRLTIVLAGVDAPELKQEFGDVAQKHLTTLVLGKKVEVEFSELTVGHVFGRVTHNQMDIGLQVIRDGVAWYDTKKVNSLSEVERRTYAEAEQAAREEKRGLWQVGSPMPPWEWRRAEAAKQSKNVTYRRTKPLRALEREDVLFDNKSSNAKTSVSKNRRGSAKPTAKPLNSPGLDYDFSPYLTQGRVSIVYFYADWCPACRALSPSMDQINSKVPDMQVLFMNIEDWNTPVTQRYGISYVPYLKIYDKSGNLVVEGRSARAWLQEALRERM